MAVYLSKRFSTPEEFEAWIAANEHGNKEFLDGLCEADKVKWDNKACKMTIKDGKLQLLCENGNVLAETDFYVPDGDTVGCDESGEVCVKGIKNANDPDGKKFRMWVGTQEEYNAILVKDTNTFYWITDDTTLDDLLADIENLNARLDTILDNISQGIIVGGKAEHATKADYATNAGYATSAGHANTSTNATNATNADHATTADSATYADYVKDGGGLSVKHAESADTATNANHATTADTADTATNANHATTADTADTAINAMSAGHASTASKLNTSTISESNNACSISETGIYAVCIAIGGTSTGNVRCTSIITVDNLYNRCIGTMCVYERGYYYATHNTGGSEGRVIKARCFLDGTTTDATLFGVRKIADI